MGVGANTSFGSDGKSKGTTVNASVNRSNSNTDETIYRNESFTNVNEAHNNTGSMVLNGFNQEGGKLTGNIGKVEVISRQNTSTTTGSSSGISLGISANGVPSSVNISGSRINGDRAFVDNQSTFIVGEESNLHVGTLENTGAVIGKQSDNSTTFKIDNYIAKNIYNEDTMTTTGGSIGASLGGKPRITSAGFNQDSRDKEGITRNTVVGNVEIQNVSGDEINRDLSKANEITKDTHSSTNINVEPQVIEYISNSTKFKEDLEVAILEGKATGETILKSIENAVNGRKSSDIGDPERRTINEIKESIIRVKTAPEMNAIATGDLNSQEVLNRLNINAIEKFNPDDPDLPENVRARLDELAEDGKTIKAFYDKATNKIFVNENLTDDAEIRASVAREWKISEDLKTGKGKANDEGKLKSTVAGELAYDDMMKRAREGKTGSISTGELNEAVMDINSEITADKWERTKLFFRTLGNLGAGATNMVVQGNKAAGNTIVASYHYVTGNKQAGDARMRRAVNNVNNVMSQPGKTMRTIQTDARQTAAKINKEKEEKRRTTRQRRQQKVAKENRNNESKQAISSLRQQIKETKDPKKKKELQAQLDSIEPHPVKEFLKSGAESIANSVVGKTVFNIVNKGLGGALEKGFTALAGSTTATVGGLFLLTSQNMGTNDETDIYSKYKNHPEVIPIFNKSKDISPKEANYIREKYPQYYNDYKIADRINPNKTDFDKHKTDLKVAGTYSMKEEKESGAKVLGTMAGFLAEPYVTSGIKKAVTKGGGAFINAFKPKNPVTRMTTAESRIAKQGATVLEEGADGVFRVPENVTKPSKSVSRRLPHNTTSSTTEVINHAGSVERIAQTAGNAAKNLKTPAIEYKAPSKPNAVEKITTNIEITGSKGKNVEIIKKIDGNTTITIEKHMSDIPPAHIIDDMTKGGMGRTSGNKSYLENYGGGKASNEVPPFANRENIHRNNSTQNYEFKSQNNGSSGSNSGGGGFKKNIEPPVKDNSNTYTLESQNANWNFNSEIPKTVVKNSEGNYGLGRNNEWSVNNNTSYLDLTTKGQGVISIQGAVKNSFNSGLDKIDKTKIASVEKVGIGAKITSENYSVLNIPKDLESVVDDIVKNGDSGGSKTENLINEIVKRDTRWEILDGKYHGNNGFDHVFRNKYTEEVWILESKQFSIPKRLPVGSTKLLKEAAGSNVQGSQDWVETILNDKLQSNNPIKKIIEKASNNGKLHIGVSGINKKDKNLIVVPVNVKN